MEKNQFNKILSLVSSDRLRTSNTGNGDLLIATESDKGRVINSASFRRLQQKAQVFSLESNAAVRSRLTHSIEVSQLGRYLAQSIVQKAAYHDNGYRELTSFVNTVETACLLHDIGNPPFGHLGESAIKEFFSNKYKNEDLSNFDGNPQGFRLVSFLNGYDSYGFNLTTSLLLSIIKYPWTYKNKPNEKKIGMFTSEYSSYQQACESLNWDVGKKFPLMLLMDTADEIAYSMSDLEDGLEKKLFRIEEIKSEFGSARFEKNASINPMVNFKTSIINELVTHAADNFARNVDEIMEGGDIKLIDRDSEIGDLLSKVNNFARDNIYCHEEVEKIELSGRSVIKGLLSHFDELLALEHDEFELLVHKNKKEIRTKKLDFESRIFNRLPWNYVEKYKESKNRCDSNEIKARQHLVVDFISGMTDDFALETYQTLEGIKIK